MILEDRHWIVLRWRGRCFLQIIQLRLSTFETPQIRVKFDQCDIQQTSVFNPQHRYTDIPEAGNISYSQYLAGIFSDKKGRYNANIHQEVGSWLSIQENEAAHILASHVNWRYKCQKEILRENGGCWTINWQNEKTMQKTNASGWEPGHPSHNTHPYPIKWPLGYIII